MTSRAGLIALVLFPLSACDCGEDLDRLQQPIAVLVHDEDEAPPLDELEVPLAAIEIGTTTTAALELRNDGGADLELIDMKLAAAEDLGCPQLSGAFSIGAPAAADRTGAVAPESSLDIEVAFSPDDGTPGCAVLVIETNDEENPTLRALFTGQGDAPRLCADMPIHDFGQLIVGDVADGTLSVRSCGARPITVSGMSGNGSFPPFSFDDSGAPWVLAPEEVLDIPVSFAPTFAGAWTAENESEGVLTLDVDDGALYQLTLLGTAVNAPICDIAVLPSLLNFGNVAMGSTETSTVIIQNQGGADCTIEDASIRDPAGPFSATLNGFVAGDVIAANTSYTVDVTFTAPGAAGVSNGYLDIVTDDPDEPAFEVPLEGSVPGEDGCQIDVSPTNIEFGVVPAGELRPRTFTVSNISDETCFLTGVELSPTSDPGFLDTAQNFGIIFAGQDRELSVSFVGQPTQGAATGVLTVETNDDDTPDFQIALSAQSGPSGICVNPEHLAFGPVAGTATLDVTISACGATAVTVTGLPWTEANPEISIPTPPGLPFTLEPGQAQVVTVQYAPLDDLGDLAVLTVQSDDGARPEVDVDVTGGPEIVPPEAGRYLYYWQIPSIAGGDVMRLPLQGEVEANPYWGPRTGQACAGCHNISPDGKYLAVVELAQMRFIDTETDTELFLGFEFLDPTFFSWRPNVNTDPPYQFAYGDGENIQIAALFDGSLGALQGADDPVLIETMPTWGPDGTIAFVRGEAVASTSDGGQFGIEGPADVLIVDENGGTPTLLAGASGDGAANYYPTYSPNGTWIAFTRSASAQSTIAAADAELRLVSADNSGTVHTLDNINDVSGASSYATWSVDGSYLSFSSNRTGGAGDWDIYIAGIDPDTGADEAAMNLNDFGLGELNTPAFEHAAQWSP